MSFDPSNPDSPCDIAANPKTLNGNAASLMVPDAFNFSGVSVGGFVAADVGVLPHINLTTSGGTKFVNPA